MPVSENRTVTLFASQARTATPVTIPSQSNAKAQARGLLVFINVSLVPGSAPSLTFTVEGKDPVSNTWYTILASASITATGFVVLRVFPGAPATANLSANDALPQDWRVRPAHGNGNSVTYSVAAQPLP